MYRDGVVRHNLGLEEALYTVLIAGAFVFLGRRHRFTGFFVGTLAVLYAPFRFGLDFMRHIDVRYFGMTPGQYGSIAVLLAGIVVLSFRRSGGTSAARQVLHERRRGNLSRRAHPR